MKNAIAIMFSYFLSNLLFDSISLAMNAMFPQYWSVVALIALILFFAIYKAFVWTKGFMVRRQNKKLLEFVSNNKEEIIQMLHS